MAMEATHVLFARHLGEALHVQDKAAYYTGCIYPDSRYVTGVDRRVTHGEGTPQDPFKNGLTDFEKGWATHLLYDRISGEHLRRLLEESPDVSKKALIEMTAMKLLEDEQSYDLLGEDASRIFGSLRIDHPPRGEDSELLRKYIDMNIALYRSKPERREYHSFFEKIVPQHPEYADAVLSVAEKIDHDNELKKKVLSIYQEVCREIRC